MIKSNSFPVFRSKPFLAHDYEVQRRQLMTKITMSFYYEVKENAKHYVEWLLKSEVIFPLLLDIRALIRGAQ